MLDKPRYHQSKKIKKQPEINSLLQKILNNMGKRTYFLLISCLVLSMLFFADQLFLQPLKKQENTLMQEKNDLQRLAQVGEAKSGSRLAEYRLTDSTVKMKEILAVHGIVVQDMSIFSATANSSKENINYSKGTLKVQGAWKNVVKSLEDIVIISKMPVTIQEIDLGQENSQISLKIFYEDN